MPLRGLSLKRTLTLRQMGGLLFSQSVVSDPVIAEKYKMFPNIPAGVLFYVDRDMCLECNNSFKFC